jgi:hypothetical protein
VSEPQTLEEIVEKYGAESIQDALSALYEYRCIEGAVITQTSRAKQTAPDLEDLHRAIEEHGLNPAYLRGPAAEDISHAYPEWFAKRSQRDEDGF